MVGVDKDRKDKIVGEMIRRDVPLMMSHRSAYKLKTRSSGFSGFFSMKSRPKSYAVWRVILFVTLNRIIACKLQDFLLQDMLV